MAFFRGPNVVTNGLVLALDAANPRSYDPLAENLLTYTSLIGASGSIYGDAGYRYDSIGSGSVTLTASIAPDGTNTATLISQSTAVTSYLYSQNTQLITSSIYTYSIFAKQGTKSDFTFTIDESNFGGKRYQFTHTFANNALTSGTTGATNNGFIINSGSLDAGNGWRRIWGTFQTSTGSVTGLVDMIARFGSTGGTTYVWGRQLEKKSFPTSYIETTNINLPTSSTWSDLSGNNNSGSLINGLTYSSASNGSFTFNGTNQYVITSDVTSSYYVSSNFTISTWVNVSSTNTGFRGIFGCFDDNTPSSLTYTGYSFWIPSGQSKFNFVTGGGGVFVFIPADSDYQTDIWYNLTGTNIGGISYFYVNGILQSTTSNQTISPPQHPVKIGRCYKNVNNFYYSGKIANGTIYTKALSAQEVLQNYNAQKSRYNL